MNGNLSLHYIYVINTKEHLYFTFILKNKDTTPPQKMCNLQLHVTNWNPNI